MKKAIILLINVLSILMLLGALTLFILWAVFLQYGPQTVLLCLWLPLLAAGFILFVLTFKKMTIIFKEFCKNIKEQSESIKIKAKHGKVFINTNTQLFKFKKSEIKIKDIVEFQLINNQTIVDKSGIGESIVGGMLFGGTGAIAGAMIGKKQKIKDNYRVFIKTKDVKHAGIVISLKIDNAYNLFETLKLVTKK